MTKMKISSLRAVALACFLAATQNLALAADGIQSHPVHFTKGASSATLKGTLKGDQIIDYQLGAKAGQVMNVTLKTSNGANYFNVLPPGSQDSAIFIGSTSGNTWTGTLEADGTYSIRLYLMRSAARRHETANYTLTVGITGSAAAGGEGIGPAPKGDAKVRGTPYHALSEVPCSMGDAAPGSSLCKVGVLRGRPGNADVHITPPGGLERVLRFMGSTVSAGDAKVKASQQGDLWLIDVNDYEHYQIPEAVISGG